MSDKTVLKRSVHSVMGVKDTAPDTIIQTNLENPQWDKATTLRYLGATLVQIGVLTGLLWFMDRGLGRLNAIPLSETAITAIACSFFTFITLRSRLFSLLDNTRSSSLYTSIQRPRWAPPPLAFPIVWMSIAVLRVVSAYLVWSATAQTFLCLPLILFMAHLSLGDTWNTIFTVEGRLGAAVPMVLVGPFLSVAIVTISYYQTLPLAGWIIAPSWVWLAIATALCISLWQLNGKEPLYPVVAKVD